MSTPTDERKAFMDWWRNSLSASGFRDSADNATIERTVAWAAWMARAAIASRVAP